MYEPREDSWMMLNVLKRVQAHRALDMGTGSGILAKELAKHCTFVIAADIDEQALNHARREVKAKNVTFIQSDLFSNISDKFDLIVFNTPYLPPTDGFSDPETTGGRELILKFLTQAHKHLNKDGKILLLFSSYTNLSEIDMKALDYTITKIDEAKFFYETLWIYELRFKQSAKLPLQQ